MHIDINCDLGESYGSFRIGNDEDLLRIISSVNIACGFHAGDYSVMRKTVALALASGAAIGAHPGLPDLQGFGRRWIAYSAKEIYEMVLYQIGALEAFAKAEGSQLNHVKPHGALYNRAAEDQDVAEAIAKAVYDFSPDLKLYGLSGSLLIQAGKNTGLTTVSEVFADRNYRKDGTLVPRTDSKAVIESDEQMAEQVIHMLSKGTVISLTGEEVPLAAETICLHGDNPKALNHARKLREMLEQQGITVRS